MARGLLIAALALLGVVASSSLAGEPLTPEEARTRWRERLAGRHFAASVQLAYRYGEDKETRSISVWRDDPKRGERLMARFETPPEMRGFAILYLEQPGRPNDYFIYQPELRRVRRISERTASEDIYGVDLEVLAFGVAQNVPTRAESLETLDLDGRPVLRLVERALEANQRFDTRIAHLDPKSFLPLRVEHVREGATVLIATTEESAVVQGVATPLRSRFVRPLESSEVVMVVESIDYEKPIPGAFFSTLSLVNR
jgi:hypothetical protein